MLRLRGGGGASILKVKNVHSDEIRDIYLSENLNSFDLTKVKDKIASYLGLKPSFIKILTVEGQNASEAEETKRLGEFA